MWKLRRYSPELKATRRLIHFILLCFFILMIFSSVTGYYLFIKKYQYLETLRHRSEKDRVSRIIEAELDHLLSVCRDWSIWDEAWSFVRDENQEFIDSNLSLNTLLTLNMSLMSFVRNDSTVKWQMEADVEEGESRHLSFSPGLFKEELLPRFVEGRYTGIVTVEGQIYLLAANRIVKGSHSDNAAGYLFLAKEMTAPLVSRLSRITNVDFEVTTLGERGGSLSPAQLRLLQEEGILRETGRNLMSSTSLWKDEQGRVTDILLILHQDRVLNKLGWETFFYYIFLTFAGLLVVVLGVLRYMRIHYFGPVRNLFHSVVHIREEGDLSFRINDSAKDEFGQLCRSFNSLLEVIQEQTRELNRHNRDLHQQANRDELTGLYNKRFYRSWLDAHRSVPPEEDTVYSFILLDVDHFKLYNDHYGHIAGDVCLRNLSRALQKVVTRESDFACRYGGEEFLIILENTDCDGGIRVAEMIQKKVASLKIPHADSPVAPFVTISMGVSSSSFLLTDPETLLDLADKGLYESKAGGRNRFTVNNPEDGSCSD